MSLIGEINRRVVYAVLKQSMTRRDERGQVRHRSTADEQTPRCFRKSANATKPAHQPELDRRRSRSTEPCPVENVEPGGERVRHRAHEIVRAGNEREETWMIDMQVVRKNVALQLREQFVWIATGFR